MREQGGLARNRTQQQMFQAAADDGVEDGVLAMRDRIDLHHVPLGALAVILRKLAERPFGLAHARQKTALDHDLRIGGHPQFAGQALDHGQRPPVQRTGDLQLVDIDRSDGLGGQQCERVDSDDDGGFERAPALLRHLEEHVGMARKKQHAEAVGPAQLAAMDRDVLLARARIAGDHQAGRDIGAAVVLVVSWQWKQMLEIDLTMDDLLRRRRCRLPPRDRIERSLLKARQHLSRLDCHCLGHPVAIGDEAGDHGDRVPPRTRKQRCARPVETLGDGRQLEAKSGAGLDHQQAIARRQMIEPVAERPDRLRRVVAVRSRRRELSAGLKRFAHGANDLLVSTRTALQNMYHRGEAGPTRPGRTVPFRAQQDCHDMTAARANRIRPIDRRGTRAPCLISARVSSRVSRAIPTRWRSSTASCA